jgi:multiple sugar transport system permease protein
MLATAFKSRLDITSYPPRFFFVPTLENFSWTYNGQGLVRILFNTVVISIGTVALALSLGIPAAYYMARTKSRLAGHFSLFVLSTRVAPPIALSLPIFVLLSEVGLRGSYLSIVLAHSAFGVSFAIWIMDGFFASIPRDIETAGQIDGLTRIGALFKVLLPAAKPGIFAAGAFTFVFSWNEFMIASLLSSSAVSPITPALPGFIARSTTYWGEFCAVALVASLPPIALFFLFRKFLVSGLTSGVIRGT